MTRSALFDYFTILISLLVLVAPHAPVSAQVSYPYQLDGTKDGIILGTSISLLTFAELKYKKIQPLSY